MKFRLVITDLKSLFKMDHSVLDLTDFVPLFVDHALSQKLATICLWCCLPFPIAVIPMNVKCHFLIFQYILSLEHWSVENTVLLLFQCVSDKMILCECIRIS